MQAESRYSVLMKPMGTPSLPSQHSWLKHNVCDYITVSVILIGTTRTFIPCQVCTVVCDPGNASHRVDDMLDAIDQSVIVKHKL